MNARRAREAARSIRPGRSARTWGATGISFDIVTDPALACGTTRDATPDAPNNSPFGTIRIRRRWTNMTGAPVSRMRFRIVDFTTLGSPNVCGGCDQADLRARSSENETGLALSGGGTADTQGLTLEVPAQPDGGGGLNSTLTVALGTPIPIDGSININFLLGVQDTGVYRFFVDVEVLNDGTPPVEPLVPSKAGRKIKPAVLKSRA